MPTFISNVFMKPLPIKRASTLFLKAALIVIALIVLVSCFFAFPNIWNGLPAEWPTIPTGLLYPGLITFYLTLIPFLIALYQAFRLLQFIDKNTAFSDASIGALRNIKFCAIAMSVLYWMSMPLIFTVADLDDAPGLIIIWAAFASAPLVIATFAAVLQKLVQNAIDMKTENDLTI